MPATIRTELTDNSKEWGDGLKRQFEATATSAAGAGKTFRDVGSSLNPKDAATYQNEIKRLSDQLGRTSISVRQMGSDIAVTTNTITGNSSALRTLTTSENDAAQRAETLSLKIKNVNASLDSQQIAKFRAEVDNLGNTATKNASKVGAVANATSSMTEKLYYASQAIGTVQSAISTVTGTISTLSAAGIPAFQKLEEATARWQKKLIAIAADPDIQLAVTKYGKAIESSLQPSGIIGQTIKGAANVATKATNIAGDVGSYAFEAVGILPEGTSKNLADLKAREAKQDAIERQKYIRNEAKRQQEEKRQEQEALENLVDPGKAMRKEAVTNDRVASFDNVEAIDNEIAHEKKRQSARIQLIKEDDGSVETDRHVIAGKELLIQLEQRRLEIIERIRAEEKAAAEERQAEMIEEQKAAQARVDLDRLAEKFNEFATVGPAVKSVKELTKYVDELAEHQDEINLAEDKYLDTLQGPLREAEEARIQRLREYRDYQAATAQAALDQEKKKADAEKAAHELKMSNQEKEYQKFKDFLKEKASSAGGGQGSVFGPPQNGMITDGFSPGDGGMDDGDESVNAGFLQSMKMKQSKGLLKKREEEAVESWRAKLKKSGVMNQQGQLAYQQDSKGNIKRNRQDEKLKIASTKRASKTAAAERRIRSEARRGFSQDLAANNLKPTEIAAAQNEAVNAAVAKVKSDGKVNDAQLNLLEKMTDELKSANAENAKNEEALKSLFQALMAGQNQRGPGGQNNVAKAQNTN